MEGGVNLYACVGNGVVVNIDPFGFDVANCEKLEQELKRRYNVINELKDYLRNKGCLDKGHTKKGEQECTAMYRDMEKYRKYCYKRPNYDDNLDKWKKVYNEFCREFGRPRGWDVPEFAWERGLTDCTFETCAIVAGVIRGGLICYRLGQQAVKCIPELLRGLRPQPEMIFSK